MQQCLSTVYSSTGDYCTRSGQQLVNLECCVIHASQFVVNNLIRQPYALIRRVDLT